MLVSCAAQQHSLLVTRAIYFISALFVYCLDPSFVVCGSADKWSYPLASGFQALPHEEIACMLVRGAGS